VSTNHPKPGSTATLNQKLASDSAENDSAQDAGMLEHPSYEELQKQLTTAEEKAAQYQERFLRIQAEDENRQRRLQRDLENAHKYALEGFVLELLPIIDSLERAITAHSEEDNAATLDGVKLTLKMFQSAFEKFNVQQVDPEGQPFNPELHQAVSTQDNSTVKPGTVLSVLQKGYQLNQRLIRPALVVVSKK
jgi:molecular chaperone GrpE